jgi:hypothetical protein
VQLTCDTGYVSSPNTSVTCLDTGQWSDDVTNMTCAGVSSHRLHKTCYNCVCTFGSLQRCRQTHHNTIMPCCVAIKCLLPRWLPYSTYTVTSLSYMSTATYTCIPGYWFHRDVITLTVTCSAEGQWTYETLLPCTGESTHRCCFLYR